MSNENETEIWRYSTVNILTMPHWNNGYQSEKEPMKAIKDMRFKTQERRICGSTLI